MIATEATRDSQGVTRASDEGVHAAASHGMEEGS